jgi:hypothetical protein
MIKEKRSVTVNGVEYPIVLAKINGKFMKRICVNRQLHICVTKIDEEYFLNGSTNINYSVWDEIKDLQPEEEYRPYAVEELIDLVGTSVTGENEAVLLITGVNPVLGVIYLNGVACKYDIVFEQFRHYEYKKTYNESKTFGVKL